ncbi:MAG: ATP-binding cassette domain-containing protein [Cyclobacteriaceae bacterium]
MKIAINNLSKRFNREWIFKNLSYEFHSAKTYAILGPNGSGKSTLLQILWGQMLPSEGSISYSNEHGVVPASEIYNSISIATPYMDLIEEFTLEEMVKFHFSFKPMREIKSSEEVIDKMELSHAKKKTISNFSSGMRQRLKLGLAFSTESEIMFLDEPTTNLDEKSKDWYWESLTPLLGKVTTIIASNQEAEYPRTAEKVDILKYKHGYNAL